MGATRQGLIVSSPISPPGMVEVIPDRCVPIAKKELMYMGTVGWACWLSGIIFIDRHKRGDAIGVISQTAKTIRRENVRGQAAGAAEEEKHRGVQWEAWGGTNIVGIGVHQSWARGPLVSMFTSLPVLCSSEC